MLEAYNTQSGARPVRIASPSLFHARLHGTLACHVGVIIKTKRDKRTGNVQSLGWRCLVLVSVGS